MTRHHLQPSLTAVAVTARLLVAAIAGPVPLLASGHDAGRGTTLSDPVEPGRCLHGRVDAGARIACDGCSTADVGRADN